jgi:MSHA biogenesis protein MshL
MLKHIDQRYLILPVVFLAGCTAMPVTEQRTRNIIESEFQSLVQGVTNEIVDVPDLVASALLPPVGLALEEYNPETERFDITARDLESREFYQALVKDTPFNIVVHPELTGKVNLELKGVTLEEVMSLARDLYGYEYRREGLLYQVLPGGMRTEIFQINYLNVNRKGGSEIQVSAGQVTNAGPNSRAGTASRGNLSSPRSGSQQRTRGVIGTSITTKTQSDFWTQLQRTLSLIVGEEKGRSVVTAPETGVVVVRALPGELRIVEDYLQRTELSIQRQVVLEAKILEVTLNDNYRQGISWSSLETGNPGQDGLPGRILDINQISSQLNNPGLQGVFSAALRTNDFDLLIELLSTQGNVQVLSSPRIATVNNQKAVIKVGSDEFFVTEIRVDQNNNINSSNQTNTDVELTPFFSGIALDVTPQISEDGRIILHVHPSISEVEDQTKLVSLGDRDLTLPLALSTIRETDSVISVLSGQVVVIGGLISDVTQDEVASVPWLGRIPVLGNAFTQKNLKTRKSELVILIKPMLATPDYMQQDIKDSRKRFSQLGWSAR